MAFLVSYYPLPTEIKMHAYSMCFFVVLLFLVNFSAAEDLEVVTENSYPYNYLDNGVLKGYAVGIVKKVMDNAGVSYTIDVYPWARAYKIAQQRENVLIFTIVRNSPREKLFKWVRRLDTGERAAYLYRLAVSENVNPTTIEEAKKYSVITGRDSMVHHWLVSRHFPKLQLVNQREYIIRMLVSGRANMLAMDSEDFEYELSLNKLSSKKFKRVIRLFDTPSYMALSNPTSDSMLKRLQKSFDELLEMGEVELFD